MLMVAYLLARILTRGSLLPGEPADMVDLMMWAFFGVAVVDFLVSVGELFWRTLNLILAANQ